MKSQLNPYISFKDNAREAMEFYKTVFGGTLEIHTFKEYNASQDPSEDDRIMHSMLTADNGIVFMGADTPGGMQYRDGARISLALNGDNLEELTGYYDKLAVGGTIHEPMTKAPWGDTFGMLRDKFGVEWMVNVTSKG